MLPSGSVEPPPLTLSTRPLLLAVKLATGGWFTVPSQAPSCFQTSHWPDLSAGLSFCVHHLAW